MTDVRPIAEADLEAFVAIVARAYPGLRLESPEARARLLDRLRLPDPITTVWGAYRDGALRGGMVLYDFTMQCYEVQIPVGGVGMVAVDLLHKKEKLARDMVRAFLDHYAAQDVPLAALYPFRPDFYRRMGFGYGSRKYQYRLSPEAFPATRGKAHLRYLTPADGPAMQDCYLRLMRRTHGLMTRRGHNSGGAVLENPQFMAVGVALDGALQGYLTFSFEAEPGASFMTNNLVVRELVYLSPEALGELFTFLNTQADQVYRVILNTQDEYFHHLLVDPRNHTQRMIPSVYHESHVAGVGIMYRILSLESLFESLGGHDFGGQSLTLAIDLADSFTPANAGRTVIRFEGGHARLAPEAAPDVTVALDVSDCSALVLGAVPFRYLADHGLVAVSDPEQIGTLDRLFRAEAKPVCMTDF